MTQPAALETIAADHFDGVSARARCVRLRIVSGQLLIDAGDGNTTQVALADVRWPERTRHGARVAQLRSGGSLQAHDAAAWDAWLRGSGVGESAVVRAQQSWRRTAIAVVLLIALAAASYEWGVPWAARAALMLLPASADKAIGDAALNSLDGRLLLPTTLTPERQQQLRESFATALARAYPSTQRPASELQFRTSPTSGDGAQATTRLGANAFALPGGTIVVTDELIALLHDRDDVLLGVLGHELGHVRQRHGMRQLVQASLIGTASSLAWGDFSSLLATAPVLLGQMAYSRDFEREADAEAITLLRANGLSPLVMVELFKRLQTSRPKSADAKTTKHSFDLGIAFASHPQDAERIQVFRDAAAH